MANKIRCTECLSCPLNNLAEEQAAISGESPEIAVRRLSILCPLGLKPVDNQDLDRIQSNGAR